MKHILFTILWASLGLSGHAQEKEQTIEHTVTEPADQDTIEVNTDHGRQKIKIIFEKGREAVDDHLDENPVYKNSNDGDRTNIGLFGGITFSRLDLGMAKMLDHGKMKLSSENNFLDYRNWKSVNIGFDVAQIGYRLSDEFRILLAAGFDWTHFRLVNDIIIKEDTSPLQYQESDIDYSKNRFGSTYLRIPLTFDLRSKEDTYPNRLHFSVGPIFGILLRGNQKFKSIEEGKHKTIDNFNYATFRYGAFLRAGYDGFGLYAKYYFNDMFQDSPNQRDLKNLSFGVMLFF